MTLPIRNFAVIISVLLIFSCNNEKDDPYKNPLKEFSIGQIDYTIYKKSYGTNVSQDGSQLDTSNGYFLLINMGITNRSAEQIKFDTSMFKLTNAIGQVFPLSNNHSDFFNYIDTCLNGLEIPSNITKHGFVIFDVPAIGDYNFELNNGNWAKEKIIFTINQ